MLSQCWILLFLPFFINMSRCMFTVQCSVFASIIYIYIYIYIYHIYFIFNIDNKLTLTDVFITFYYMICRFPASYTAIWHFRSNLIQYNTIYYIDLPTYAFFKC